ncbi:MAG: hypothetical protein QMA97_04815 [Glaciecola sp.]
MKPAKSVIVNIMHAIGSILIDTDAVGKNNELIDFGFKRREDDNGNRLFSHVTSGEWFRKKDIDIKNKWGQDTVTIAIAIGTDKTHLDRKGAQKVS